MVGGFSDSAIRISAMLGSALMKHLVTSCFRKVLLMVLHWRVKFFIRRAMALEKLATSLARALYAGLSETPSTGCKGTVILQLLGILSVSSFIRKRFFESQ